MINTENSKIQLPFAKQVANFLNYELKQRGITQKKFANMTGYSERQIRRWLKGDIGRLENVDDIIKTLNVSIRDIVFFGDDVPDAFL